MFRFLHTFVRSFVRSFAYFVKRGARVHVLRLFHAADINPRVFLLQFLLLNSSFGFLSVSLSLHPRHAIHTAVVRVWRYAFSLVLLLCAVGMIDALLMKYTLTHTDTRSWISRMCALIHFHFIFSTVFVRHFYMRVRLESRSINVAFPVKYLLNQQMHMMFFLLFSYSLSSLLRLLFVIKNL